MILLFFYILSFSNECVKKEFTYKIIPKGIEILNRGKFNSSTFTWDKIKKVYETKNNFILVTSVIRVIIIPRRCLNSIETINMFKQILRFKLTELHGTKNINKYLKFQA